MQDTALCELDYLIEGRYAIHAHHQNDLDSLCRMPMEQLNDRDRFVRYGQIFDRYRAFNIDLYMQTNVWLYLEALMTRFIGKRRR